MSEELAPIRDEGENDCLAKWMYVDKLLKPTLVGLGCGITDVIYEAEADADHPERTVETVTVTRHGRYQTIKVCGDDCKRILIKTIRKVFYV